MQKRQLILATTAVILAGMVIALFFLLKPYFNGVRPAWFNAEDSEVILQELARSQGNSGPFWVHEDFAFSIFSQDVKNPRVLIEDAQGNVLVSEPEVSRVSLLTPEGQRKTLVEDLRQPHGLALRDNFLYVAESGQVLRFSYSEGKIGESQVLLSLPAGGRHWTRTIGFGPDEALYISIGSSCNICLEEDWRRDKILRYNLETQELTPYATGLRNAVFFAWHPETGQMYATEMGRDWLGDDLPPDELNLIELGADYGFPFCYGNTITDPEFAHLAKCEETVAPLFEFGAHEAPLGIDFHKDDLIVALHGSWNRAVPVGYEVIRLTADSNYQRRESIFSGFLREDGSSIGRPAGVLTLSSGDLLISDDKANAIYRLSPL